MKRKPLIGLAGGIGAGKSTVAALLAEMGVKVIDSDALARRQLQDPRVVAELRSWWGADILDASGAVDRARVATKVFADVEQRRRLEQLIHPLVAAERDRLIAQYQDDPALLAIVLDTPLLIESGLDRCCDAVVFVEAGPEVRRERVCSVRGWTTEDWERREKTQNALDNKRKRADHVVVNNSSDPNRLRLAVQDLLHDVLQGFAG